MANINGPSIRDESPWNNLAQAQAATPGEAPVYVPGSNPGDSALRLTAGSDNVQLTAVANTALDFAAGQSFTAQIVMRTTDTDGVIIGTNAGEVGWSLWIAQGHLVFTLTDSTANSSQIISTNTINDGVWHRFVVVRDAVNHQLLMYIDGVPAATAVADTTLDLTAVSPFTLGSYANGTAQLSLDVDTLHVTRTVVDPSQFLSATFTAPARFPTTVYPAGAPNSIAGLQLWLPAYDPTTYFADWGAALPLPLAPVVGTAAHSAIEASSNHYYLSMVGNAREALYEIDSVVGPSWDNTIAQWVAQNSSGADANNFDFVQDTGVFTLSAFVKTDPGSSSYAIFDTNDATAANTGFSFEINPNGSVSLWISDSNGNLRFAGSTAQGLVMPGGWYQVAVVGNGAGNPVTFYVTAASATTVAAYTSSASISGDNGDYATLAGQNLVVGASITDRYNFQGQMVDQAIYNRALSAAEIQQLFDYTKKP